MFSFSDSYFLLKKKEITSQQSYRKFISYVQVETGVVWCFLQLSDLLVE